MSKPRAFDLFQHGGPERIVRALEQVLGVAQSSGVQHVVAELEALERFGEQTQRDLFALAFESLEAAQDAGVHAPRGDFVLGQIQMRSP